MSEVFFLPSRPGRDEAGLAVRISALWQQAGLANAFQPKDLTALKLHVGEPGRHVNALPAIARQLVRCIEATGARPFLTDTVVLYRSPRDNAVGHARVAHEHGFGFDAMGAPFVVADGLSGTDALTIALQDGKHFDEVSMAAAIMHARSMLVLSHATGHLGTGFGGALKNLGMGCCSKQGKLKQHHGQQPRIKPTLCTACGHCAEWCPSDAIVVGDDHASIQPEACIGCGECIAECQEGAVTFAWSVAGAALQERIAEHAAAVVRSKPGRIAYVTVAEKITKNCDCISHPEDPLIEDIGILASHDPVAIDEAVLQLVQQREGRTLESLAFPRLDGTVQLQHAQRLGLGERRVELVPVDG